MTEKKSICPGCLREDKVILEEGCGSQRCPPSEMLSEAEVAAMQKERDDLDNLIKFAAKRHAGRKKFYILDEYAAWARTMWLSDKLEERDLTIMSLGLAGETGEVLELLKKRVRDGNLDMVNLKKELGDVIYYWVMLCNAFGLQPTEVMMTNVEKVEGRYARGTLQGSGDDR